MVGKRLLILLFFFLFGVLFSVVVIWSELYNFILVGGREKRSDKGEKRYACHNRKTQNKFIYVPMGTCACVLRHNHRSKKEGWDRGRERILRNKHTPTKLNDEGFLAARVPLWGGEAEKKLI